MTRRFQLQSARPDPDCLGLIDQLGLSWNLRADTKKAMFVFRPTLKVFTLPSWCIPAIRGALQISQNIFLLTPRRMAQRHNSANKLIHFSVFQVRSKIARGACDQPKAGCMGPVVSYNLILIGHFHSTRSCHWIILESWTPVDSWLSTNTGTN